MKQAMVMAVFTLLAGCGVETAGTAAVQGELRAREVEQARQMQEDVAQKLEATQQLEQQRLDEQLRAMEQ